MKNRYENYILAQQLVNLAGKLNSRSGLREKLAEWFCEDGGQQLGVIVPEYDEDAKRPLRRMRHLSRFSSNCWGRDKKPIPISAWKELHEILAHLAARLKTQTKSTLQKNIDVLAREVGLDRIDKAIFGLAVRVGSDDIYKGLCDTLFASNKISLIQLTSLLLKLRTGEVSNRLRRSSQLSKSGLIKIETNAWSSDFSDFYELPESILRAVQPPNQGISDIEKTIFGAPCTSELAWKDFEYLGEQSEFITRLVQGAVQEKAKGVNILIYGIPGVGKTEFCKMIAARLNFKMYAIGETTNDGDEPNRKQRIADLRLSDLLLARHKSTILLFDEMEDLVEDGFGSMFSSGSSSSKVFINRLLENNSLPTLWTCNEISEFDPALLRRMSLAVEFKLPPKAVRERIWKKTALKNKLDLSLEDISDLAQTVKGPPSMIANAVRTVKLAGGGEKQIRLSVRKMAKVAGRSVSIRPKIKNQSPFNPALVNADMDLVKLTKQIVERSEAKNFSFCFYGAAGTGKSAYVRYLAKSMGLEVLHKRTSDLTSMWVGQTEKNIANAFEEANDREAFLIFDEADSLLADRRSSKNSWEVTQVNEMLTWMESHPLPFACTTNLMDNLDPASLRRFTFKINCRYLSPKQARAAFAHFFNMEAPKGIDGLSALTPGDFAVVKNKAAITGKLSNSAALLQMLQGECALKPDISSPIGFGAAL